MTNYDAVTIVVLNQADRLTPRQQQECRRSLRLVKRDGLTKAKVLATSARTGRRRRVARGPRASRRGRPARAPTDADACGRLPPFATRRRRLLSPNSGRERKELVTAPGARRQSANGRRAVRRDYQRQAVAATGWPSSPAGFPPCDPTR